MDVGSESSDTPQKSCFVETEFTTNPFESAGSSVLSGGRGSDL